MKKVTRTRTPTSRAWERARLGEDGSGGDSDDEDDDEALEAQKQAGECKQQ
jgi:hypothetical protein